MLKDLATTDRVITITPGGGWTPGVPTYTEHPSNKVKAGGKSVLLTRISWNLAAGACVMAGYNHGGGATNNPIPSFPLFPPGITKVHETNLPVWMGEPICKGDKGNCLGLFVLIVPPFTVVNCTCTFEVTNGGQSKAKGQ